MPGVRSARAARRPARADTPTFPRPCGRGSAQAGARACRPRGPSRSGRSGGGANRPHRSTSRPSARRGRTPTGRSRRRRAPSGTRDGTGTPPSAPSRRPRGARCAPAATGRSPPCRATSRRVWRRQSRPGSPGGTAGCCGSCGTHLEGSISACRMRGCRSRNPRSTPTAAPRRPPGASPRSRRSRCCRGSWTACGLPHPPRNRALCTCGTAAGRAPPPPLSGSTGTTRGAGPSLRGRVPRACRGPLSRRRRATRRMK